MPENPATAAPEQAQSAPAAGPGSSAPGQTAPVRTHPYNAASSQRENVLRGYSEQKNAILQAVSEQREAMLDPIRDVNARNATFRQENAPRPAPAPGPHIASGLGSRVLGPRGASRGGIPMADQSQIMAEIVASIRTIVADEVRKQLVLLMDQADAQVREQKQQGVS